jgi:hypothetical protein
MITELNSEHIETAWQEIHPIMELIQWNQYITQEAGREGRGDLFVYA